MNRKFIFTALQCGIAMGALLFCAASASAATPVTFQVDMTAQVTAGTFIPGSNTVSAHGTFNGWEAVSNSPTTPPPPTPTFIPASPPIHPTPRARF